MSLFNKKINKVFLILVLFAGLISDMSSYAGKNETQEIHDNRYYSSRADELANSNSWEVAKSVIDEGLKYYPDDPELRYQNGRYYYYAQNDLQRSRYNLTRALQESDHHWGARRLLIDVEDDSKHYSSAICYINELLEQQPYDRDLWRRKIGLYRKLDNKVEADAALERLARIYPNDTLVVRDLKNLQREDWNNRLLNTNELNERLTKLEGWIIDEPDNPDYYIQVADIYIRKGEYDNALNTVNRGLANVPRNARLVQKAATLMSEQGLYTRVLTFLKENRVGGKVYENALRDAANDARLRDAYEINGRLYSTTGDKETLAYLLNTSLTRGYYDDAMGYLNEAYKLEGRTSNLLMKEYELQKRMGNDNAARKLLVELFANNPDDEDLRDQYIAMQLQLANIDSEQMDWGGAYDRLTDVVKYLTIGSEEWVNIEARRINFLGRAGRFEEARRLYGEASTDDPAERQRFAYAYEEFIAARIKSLIENERYEEALIEGEKLLATIPDSETGIRTCINMSQTLRKNELFYKYAEKGYEMFPDQPYFITKEAIALEQQKMYADALNLLNPKKQHQLYITSQLIGPYSGVTENYAVALMRDKKPKVALARLDSALVYDPDNRELLYLKGLAYEQLKEYKQAYRLQFRNYNPSNAEQGEWYEHMRYLHTKSLSNRFEISYTSSYYDTRSEELASIGHMYSVASLSYTHIWKNTTLTLGANYKATDGFEDAGRYKQGGTGLEGIVGLSQYIGRNWTFDISGSYGSKQFNKFGGNLGITKVLPKGWSLGAKASYRLTPPMVLYEKDKGWTTNEKRYNLLMLGPRLSKEWEKVGLHLNVDAIALDLKNYYYNASLKAKFFINEDGVSSISAIAGVGSFPELDFFDEMVMNGISNMNGMVGVDFNYLLTKNLILGVAGNWNTYYNPDFNSDGIPVDSYRNIYSVTGYLQVCF
ncbi:MAG: tetratricopeptide repeat protein [Muribaculaceae bacterium]|nr:tetratricopeptide repeat protein [Muribaculaceae bacterium]